MIEKNEQFLREYKYEEKINIHHKIIDNTYNKIHKLVIESINKLYGINYFPLKNLIYPKSEAFEFLKYVILTYWNGSNLDTTFSDDGEIELYEKKLIDCLESDLLVKISELSRCNFPTFLSLLSLEDDCFLINRSQNYLLSIYCIPIGDGYLVHTSFDESEKFDFILLQEKFKSLVLQYPLTKRELTVITENYEDIGIVITSLELSNDDFLEDNIFELYDAMHRSKYNNKYKKEIYLFKLKSAMNLLSTEGSKDFNNVFDLDLGIRMDTSFYTKLNYSKVQNLVKEIIAQDYLNHFEEKLTEIEKTYIYYCLFIAVYAGNAYKSAIQIGEYLLENNKVIKFRKALIQNYGCRNGKDNVHNFLKRYDTALLPDFYTKLIDAYVKEKQYVSAMVILEKYNEASSVNIRKVLTENSGNKMDEIIIEQLNRDLEGDICLLITDYDYYMFNEEHLAIIIDQWNKKIQEENFAKVIYKPLEQHLLNIIMVTFANGRQNITHILIDVFYKYFNQSKEMFEQFYHFIIMNSEDEKLIDKELLNSLKKAEVYLAKIQQTSRHTAEVKDELIKVKKIYENSGTILNDYLTNKKMDALSSVLQKNLEEQTYSEIIDEVISEMKIHLDASNVKKEEIHSYYARLKSIERLGSIWDKLEEDSKVNLATGMYLYDTQKVFLNNTDSDFSATIINWCLAVENELENKIYRPFKHYCESKKIRLENFNWNRITFGTYIGIFGYKSTSLSRNTFYDFCTVIYPNLRKKEIIELVKSLERKLEVARKQYRNKAAHPEILDEKNADDCYDLFFPTQNLLKDMLIHYERL